MSHITRTKSEHLFEEAKTLFPGGVNSPVRAFKSVSGAPLFIRKGFGPHLEDVDGNQFLDFCCSWGPLILGHAHPMVIQAIMQTMENGTSFGAPSELGNRLGKLIVENHKYVDRIRFVSSGTEAVMSALRLARGITGKSKILKFEGCYHGHVDSLLVKAGSGLATFGVSTSAGIPASFAEETLVIPLDHIQLMRDTIAAHASELAAVIIEPIPANNGLLIQRREFMHELRDACSRHDVLLIFDEVISGFRIGFEGAAGYYEIEPDLITFGKIIGGGMPVGAFAGSQEYMSYISPDGPVYQAGTLSANPIAMTAGYATLQYLLENDIYGTLEALTKYFVHQIDMQQKENFRVQHIGSIFWLSFADSPIRSSEQIPPTASDYFKKLHQFLLDEGIYLGPSAYEVGFISAVHTKDQLTKAAEIISEGVNRIYEG